MRCCLDCPNPNGCERQDCEFIFEAPPNPPPVDVRSKRDQVLDLSWFEHDYYKVERWADGSHLGETSDDRHVTNLDDADIISSQIAGTNGHTIMLDLDVPARLVPSSTKGHSHLYIDVVNDWDTICYLLDALGMAGVLEPGYVRASKERGYTALRLPWVRKEVEAE